MLYNGHVVIVETFLRNRPNHGQILIEKPLNSGHFYSGHLLQRTLIFEHRVNILGKIYLLLADTSMIGWEKENTCTFLFDAFLYFNMKLII